ncbi:DUF2306 domain-containing protein [Nonomuraea typhae]|uniref:DUF2306 domain-containing protein n=1 Tax=Nonomuraea typhae TaxID=2603600 RepID=A0ABW7YX19_9ACTN
MYALDAYIVLTFKGEHIMVVTSTPASSGSSRSPASSRQWWRHPWLALLAALVAGFLIFSVPPYLTLRPELSRIPAPPAYPWYYSVLAGHVWFASVAMVASCLQIWPWLRNRHHRVHRWTGRVYVFCGALPAGVLGLAIAFISPTGLPVRVSNVVLASLWLAVTVIGYRRARQRRYGEHREWMVRGFALTMSILATRVVGLAWVLALLPELDTTYGGSVEALTKAASAAAGPTGWLACLLAAEWHLRRRSPDRARNR